MGQKLSPVEFTDHVAKVFQIDVKYLSCRGKHADGTKYGDMAIAHHTKCTLLYQNKYVSAI